ncbi:GMP synthase, glutamine amidotransferase domain [Nitrosopumilaceae archaeon]|nr:gamma-glutamyl-gamma-aminobutyrate hydrolase family protein [Nitrosopumilus sp.]CAI9831726.1 GMP synthase, glutamine amidotransferase domain [Nitrosopumilaceae archaeon]MDA7941026.1 gamma-glutamyl-gamma-aminobutyrate hydrolase family protein [Nitrosopumilus sp.]MDA7942576.1 gamma-glutamyl-gamma-aminobutyrate hydrolase family protein [Nitrosopumilus sp.]MDA7944461.1 gamma-glutamyl-gamma-aminobutyrate hydrolase family protein [Nitrosopumilus sp.]
MDNGSAYTGQIEAALDGLGVAFEKTGPLECAPGRELGHSHVILSGRRRNDRRANAVNSRIAREAARRGTRLLGICYGAEVMALALGGTIRRRGSPRRGKATARVIRENPLCSGSLVVEESHSYEVARLPAGMSALAESDGCTNEMIGHHAAPLFGTQFHPEASPDGRALLARFCSL